MPKTVSWTIRWRQSQLEVLVASLLFASVTLFFSWRLGSLDAYLYKASDSPVSDLTITFWSNITYIQQTLSDHGELPLWRTLIFSGSPFDVDPQSGLWYPPNIIFLFLPAVVGFNLLFGLHAVAAGLGMWTWSRATGTSTWGALLAAMAYTFAPKAYAHLGTGHAGLFYAAAYVPWVLWSTYRIGRGSWNFAGVLGLSLGLQLIAHPQLAFYTGLVAGCYGLSACLAHSRKSIRRAKPVSAGLLLGALLTISIAAVQLFPLLSFAPLSARASLDFSGSSISSLPWRYIWGLIIADQGGFMDYMLYVGLPVLALALLALNRRQARFWWLFVILALIFSLGANTPLYGIVLRFLPALNWLRAPARIWFVASAVLALLAGWGLDHVMAETNARIRRMAKILAVALGGFGLAFLLGSILIAGRPAANLAAFGIVAPATGLLLVGLAQSKVRGSFLVVSLFVVILADLWVVDATLVKGIPPGKVFSDSGLGVFLAKKNEQDIFRVYSPSYSLPRHIAAQYGLETADGVDPLFLEDYDRFMEMASGIRRRHYGVTIPAMEGQGTPASVNSEAIPDPKLLGLLNVLYVAAEFPITSDALREIARFGPTYLYENQYFLPRAFVLGDVEPVLSFEAALDWLGQTEFTKRAVVENGLNLNSGDVKADIHWLEKSPNRIKLYVHLDKPGLLVLSQGWYPGWRADVNGQSQEIYRVNGILSGIYLDSGESTIILKYQPPLLVFCLLLSFSGVFVSFGIASRRFIRGIKSILFLVLALPNALYIR